MKSRNMAQCALFAALLTLCAWISIPMGDIAFTLQTLGVFLTLQLLGGKRGTAAIGVYLAMGAVGLPVFSGFRGGLGILLGASGGYLFGFLFSGLLYWLACSLGKNTPTARFLGCCLGLFGCYCCGTAWFCLVYLSGEPVGVAAVLVKCVLPYLLPDLCKLWLAWLLSRRISKEISA